ncbi:thioredoxin domain-containing protein (plasmid) [Streptomyces sp. BI20]|uniref:thioredoxin domain-containing protein n=1 Tax=Streptomyces sp. BI20 TaxID=3403460 RepID=UPI003C719B77
MQERREAEANAARRKRRAAIAAVVVAGAAVVAGGFWAARSGGSGASPSPGANSVAKAKDGPLVTPGLADGVNALVYGDKKAPHTLDVYEDPRCPFCGIVERGLGEEMQRQADAGKYKIVYHLASFLDGPSGSGSKNAVSALAAAANQGPKQFAALHAELYKDQPDEREDVFADSAKLLALAARAPGLDQAALKADVDKGTYVPWAIRHNETVNKSLEKTWQDNSLPGRPGTPAVLLDGHRLEVLTGGGGAEVKAVGAKEFTALVDAALPTR